jgi:hypothetical protein
VHQPALHLTCLSKLGLNLFMSRGGLGFILSVVISRDLGGGLEQEWALLIALCLGGRRGVPCVGLT